MSRQPDELEAQRRHGPTSEPSWEVARHTRPLRSP